jgi:uncharacterized protein YcnI
VFPHARTWHRAVVAALAATLLVALPAGAHPFVRGGEVPVDSLATVTLAMAHGCGTEDRGGGDPTLEIALEVPEEVRIVDVADDPAYDHELEADEDGRIAVVTWTATGDGEPAPDVEFDAVFRGEPGDEVYLRVFQGCEDFAYRWIGTPDDPAEDPAVRVSLVAADDEQPAPPDDEPTVAEEEAAPVPTTSDDADRDDGATDEDAATDDAEDEVTEEGVAVEDGPEALDAEAAAEEDGSGFPVWLLVVLVAVAGIGIALARRARGDAAGSAGDGTAAS